MTLIVFGLLCLVVKQETFNFFINLDLTWWSFSYFILRDGEWEQP